MNIISRPRASLRNFRKREQWANNDSEELQTPSILNTQQIQPKKGILTMERSFNWDKHRSVGGRKRKTLVIQDVRNLKRLNCNQRSIR